MDITESFSRIRTHFARQREKGNTFCDHAPDIGEVEAMMDEIEWLRAALQPLADIPLWRDTYPDANIDRTLQSIECITVGHVRAARLALGAHEQRVPAKTKIDWSTEPDPHGYPSGDYKPPVGCDNVGRPVKR